MIKTSLLVSCDNKHPRHRDPDLEPGPYLVWVRLLPRYLGIKATAGSLTTFNNQCFMFYTQQMSGPGDHGLTLTLAPGDQGHRGDDEGGQHPEHAETCHGVCCQAGAPQILSAGMAPSVTGSALAPALTGTSQ